MEGSPEWEGHSYRVMLLVLVAAAMLAVCTEGTSASTASGSAVRTYALIDVCMCNALTGSVEASARSDLQQVHPHAKRSWALYALPTGDSMYQSRWLKLIGTR
jgi:hypothetical protein